MQMTQWVTSLHSQHPSLLAACHPQQRTTTRSSSAHLSRHIPYRRVQLASGHVKLRSSSDVDLLGRLRSVMCRSQSKLLPRWPSPTDMEPNGSMSILCSPSTSTRMRSRQCVRSLRREMAMPQFIGPGYVTNGGG
jgi:hypothetical protein